MRHWFTMKKVDDDEEEDDDKKKNPFAEIMIYDAIGQSFMGEQTVSASAFVIALAELGDIEEIKLRINSPGGDVFDGVAIYNAIKNHKAKVTAHVDGLAASAASFVAMAADRIVMPSNAFMLVHNASGFAMGQADDLKAVAADLERIDKSMLATYVARTGQPTARLRALMKEDRLMDAKEAKELGFTDEVTAPVKVQARYSLHLLSKAAAAKFLKETGIEQVDPPLLAPAPERPVAQPVASPASSNVVDFGSAKKQGIEEHRAYVAMVTDFCTLASAPERVGAYVRANTPLEQVRKDLLEMQAAASILPQHPLVPKQPTLEWSKITDKLNARTK